MNALSLLGHFVSFPSAGILAAALTKLLLFLKAGLIYFGSSFADDMLLSLISTCINVFFFL